MDRYRANAVAAGIFFIVATGAGIASVPLAGGLLAEPDFLGKLAANGNQFTFGALLVFAMGLASPSIAFALYPVLRKYGESLGLASVALRVIEGAFDVLSALLMLTLLNLSRNLTAGGGMDPSATKALGQVLLDLDNWVNGLGVLGCWIVGAFIYYYIFFRTRLIPRWLSLWGMLGLVLTAIGIGLYTFGLLTPMSQTQMVLYLPILVQELVFALWLIVKGFDQSALASLASKKA